MKKLVFADSRGQHRPAGSTHTLFSQRLYALEGLQVDHYLCPFKWTTTLDFFESFSLDRLRQYDRVVLYTGIVDWSPRKLSNARDDLYENHNEANLGALKLNTEDYRKKIVNRKKATFDRIFGEDAMRRHLAAPFEVTYEGEPTINMYSLAMAEHGLLPRLQSLPNLVFINANRFVAGWRGDYSRERPANISITHAYSDLFSRQLGDRVVDLRVWDDEDIKRFTCDNLHLSAAGNEYIFNELCKKLGLKTPTHSMSMTKTHLISSDPAKAASFVGLVAANRALRDGDNEGAYAKAKRLFEESGRASHFHTALIAARRTQKQSHLNDLFNAAERLGTTDAPPDSAESAYLRRFAFVLLNVSKRRVAELAARPRLSSQELLQLEAKLCDPGVLQQFIKLRTDIVEARVRDEFRHILHYPQTFPYNYLTDYQANVAKPRPAGAPRVKSVTLIYPIKNRSQRTLVSLLSLGQAYRTWIASTARPRLSIDVIVAEDQGNDAFDASKLSSLPFDSRHLVIETGVKWTRSGLINQGLNVAKGDFVAFVDADVLFPTDFLVRLSHTLNGVDVSDRVFAFNMFETHTHAKEGKLHSAGMPYSYMWGLLRKHALAVGGFSEAFIGWGSEDRDFEYRVCQKQGLKALSSLYLPGQPYVLHLSHDVRTGNEHRDENVAQLSRVKAGASVEELVAKPALQIRQIGQTRVLARSDLRATKPALLKQGAARREKTLVIMGNGPSLGEIMNNSELLQTLRGYDTFGLNAAYRAYDRYDFYPTYFGSFDFRVCDSHAEAFSELVRGQNPIKRFFFAKQSVFDNQTKAHQRFQVINFRAAPQGVSRQTKLSASFDDFDDCGSSGTNAVQAGYLMGYRHFILLGVDCNYVEILDGVKDLDGIRYEVVDEIKSNPNYWFEGYQIKGDKFHKPNEKDIQLVSWAKLDTLLSNADGYISNCSLVSKLPMFDILSFGRRSAAIGNLFLVMSCAAYSERIAALRERYAGHLRPGDQVLYVIGGSDRNFLGEDAVLHLTAGDLYEDLPQKVQAAIEFCVKNLDFERIIKVDDDIHVNFDNLYEAMPRVADHAYLGRRTPTRAGITPSSSWHFGKVSPGSLNEGLHHKVEGPPEFWAGGGMYVLSRDAASHLATTLAHQAAHFHLYEDFMVGDLLARQDIQAQPWDELPVSEGRDWCITNLRDIMSEDLKSVRDPARMRRAISVHCGPYPPYYKVSDMEMRDLFRLFDAT
jgi:glycosyltransferase involved in cell wall biosynthesis